MIYILRKSTYDFLGMRLVWITCQERIVAVVIDNEEIDEFDSIAEAFNLFTSHEKYNYSRLVSIEEIKDSEEVCRFSTEEEFKEKIIEYLV